MPSVKHGHDWFVLNDYISIPSPFPLIFVPLIYI
jgi:hypothetical protein